MKREQIKLAVLGVIGFMIKKPRIAKEQFESFLPMLPINLPTLNDTRVIKMCTTWPRHYLGLEEGLIDFMDKVEDLSSNNIIFKYYPSGTKISTYQCFDVVKKGYIHMYHSFEYYWQEKHPGFTYFSAIPFGLSSEQFPDWLNNNGGQKLWDELSKKFGLKCLPCGTTGNNIGIWSNKELNDLDDFKGLKVHLPGLGGKILEKLGAIHIDIPQTQILEKLKNKEIDMAAWIGPWHSCNDDFHKVAKYYYPAFHEPSTLISLGINLDYWKELNEWEQEIITTSATWTTDEMTKKFSNENKKAIKKLNKVEIKEYPPGVYNKLKETSLKILEEYASYDLLTNRIYSSIKAYKKNNKEWAKINNNFVCN
ncbi:Bacterial extracellular solute-binding protein, family 7 [seawater metagenome]|uniref:Bacterial extracellular solute-binding protein, family 7 n=1 Tax=seawater metagenome TaxID=1561972 RepID=A0A5E8CK93_9ZZZZ